MNDDLQVKRIGLNVTGRFDPALTRVDSVTFSNRDVYNAPSLKRESDASVTRPRDVVSRDTGA